MTLLGAPDINTFVLNGNGVPGNAIQNPSTAPLPFGFSWDARNHLVVSQVHDPNGTPTGDTATYSLTHDRAPRPDRHGGDERLRPVLDRR